MELACNVTYNIYHHITSDFRSPAEELAVPHRRPESSGRRHYINYIVL